MLVSPAADLGVVAHPLQEAVRDPRRAARAAGDERGGVSVEGDVEDLGRSAQDVLELRLGVVVEPIGHAESVAQRPGDAPHPRRRADDGDLLDLQPDRARARALAEHDVEGEVLHRRVQDLLDDVAEPMDLVDEQHVALAQAGQDRGQVAGPLDGRARGGADLSAHLGGDDVRERRLAQPRRAVQEDVVDRLGAMLGSVDQDRQVLLDPILSGELVEATRPDGRLERALVLGHIGRGDALDRHRSRAGESNM